MPQAFDGLRVIDLSTRLSGAWAARLFADFGAEVTMLEPPDGHPLRHEPPFLGDAPGAESSLLHAYANWNKRSAIVDGDVTTALAGADVVVTTDHVVPDMPPGAVHLSITPHGLTGPLAEVPGNNLTNCARVGWATINRLEGEPPLQLPVRQTGYIAGVAGFIAAAAALYRGGGERLDVSETEAAALTCVPWAVMGIFIGGGAAAFGPNGKRARGRPGPLWRAADGLINYGYGDWQQWTNAMRFLGLDDLALDERFVNAWGRHQQDTRPVRNGLAESSAFRPKWDLFHGLAKLRCISGVVQDAKELRESEQFAARDFLVETRIDGRMAHATGAPAKLSATPWRLAKPAPVLGERDAADLRSDDLRAAEPRGGSPGSGQPLSGIRVLCFTQAWAGTFCTELLALLGADVVQIETVKRPDVWRGAGAPVPPAVRNPDIEQAGINTNGMYNTVNLNKRAINLDVTHPRGKDIFWRLIPRFDVLVDNFSPHVMTNWGVTLETLHEHNPGMIFASVSGYGRQGPLAEYPANGATHGANGRVGVDSRLCGGRADEYRRADPGSDLRLLPGRIDRRGAEPPQAHRRWPANRCGHDRSRRGASWRCGAGIRRQRGGARPGRQSPPAFRAARRLRLCWRRRVDRHGGGVGRRIREPCAPHRSSRSCSGRAFRHERRAQAA